MPSRIRTYCAQTSQPVPETTGQVMRAVYESLALKYRHALDRLIILAKREVNHLHIIGGGTQNKLLNQFTANATGRTVITGPIEATALGNAIVQFITLGELDNVAQAREILSKTVGTETYQPQDSSQWQTAYEHFSNLVEG
jgi:sugar (pentulose or hexulose) kinase